MFARDVAGGGGKCGREGKNGIFKDAGGAMAQEGGLICERREGVKAVSEDGKPILHKQYSNNDQNTFPNKLEATR